MLEVPDLALTARQEQVMRLAAEGLPNKMIAEKLGITEGTVKLHLHAIYERLGLPSRRALAAYVRNGTS